MPKETTEKTKLVLSAALESEDFKRLSAAFPEGPEEVESWSLEFWKTRQFPSAIAERLSAANRGNPGDFLPYRFLLLRNSLHSLRCLEEWPVDDEVKVLMCNEYRAFAVADPEWLHFFDPAEYSFRALLGISIGKRFRAGLLDWEDAGFPRSWFPRIPRKDLLPTLYHLLFRMGGLKPFWFPHNAFLRGRVQFMREREWEASLLLMAKSMKLQPEIKGVLTGSWFYAPETHKVTPHLAWTTRIFLENGAFMTNTGPADPKAGFMQGAKDRQALYEKGEYRPTETILLWPRKNIMRWLENRPVKPRQNSLKQG
jgi:hypothetical protein